MTDSTGNFVSSDYVNGGLVILVMTCWVRDIISKMHHEIAESNGQFGGHKHCTEF